MAAAGLWTTFGQTITGTNTTQGLYIQQTNAGGDGFVGESQANNTTLVYVGVIGLGLPPTPTGNELTDGVEGVSSIFRGVAGFVTANGNGGAGVVGSNPATSGSGIGVLGFSQVDNGGYFFTASTSLPALVAQSAASSATNPGLSVIGTFTATGTKSFIQPHPTDPSKTIEYVCLEGGEAGTYWRGTAQLVNGEAIVTMPDHFRLVTNANGVTAQVTPLGPTSGLYVAERLVVRASPGAPLDTAFDFFVQGLRVGFEGHQPLRPARPSDSPKPIRPELYRAHALSDRPTEDVGGK